MHNIPELCIIIYILIYNNYIKYIKYIAIDKEYIELTKLYNALKHLHEDYPDTDKTVDDLEVMILQLYPAMSKSDKAVISDMCKQLRAITVSPDIAKSLLESIADRSRARELALKSLNYSEGRLSLDELQVCISEFSKPVQKVGASYTFVTTDLDELEHMTIAEGGLYWPLPSLNVSLGPLRKGDFGFVFARPETGKTTFIAHACTHMAKQSDQPIIWFNNEEAGGKVQVRAYQSALGVTTDELFHNKGKHGKDYNSFYGGRLRILDDAFIHRNDVEALLSDLNPGLVVIDQIDKIKGFSADRPDLVFGRIYQWARELAKKHCPIIGTCQSDGSGEGVKWLTMSHVAEAKTAKQAEADWILGIGKSNEAGTESVRFFNISKNKLMGDSHTDPELRHGRFDVWIRPQIARYEDIT